MDPINDLIFCDGVAVQVAEEGAVLPTPNLKKGEHAATGQRSLSDLPRKILTPVPKWSILE